MASVPPPTIDELGVPGALHLAALLDASNRRLRVAPTRRMTLALMAELREMALIDVPWPDPRWEIAPNARDTPIEGLQWRYLWTAYIEDSLVPALREFLQSVPRDEYAIALRMRLWRELAVAEGERFFETQLTRHQFDPGWAQDRVFVQRDCGLVLSAAQWRYCCWAATRHGAALAQQQRVPDPAAIREATYAELRKRIGPVVAGRWATNFVPFNLTPESALTRLFVDVLTPLGDAFWHLVPNEMALLAPYPSRNTAEAGG